MCLSQLPYAKQSNHEIQTKNLNVLRHFIAHNFDLKTSVGTSLLQLLDGELYLTLPIPRIATSDNKCWFTGFVPMKEPHERIHD